MESVHDHLFLRKEIVSLHQSITVGHARHRTLSERGLPLRHALGLNDVDTLHPETMGQDSRGKTIIDRFLENVHGLQFGALSMFLALDPPSLRVALHLRFIRTEWRWQARARILRRFVILANRLPSHLQAIVIDLRFAEVTRLRYQSHRHVKQFLTVNAHLNLSAGAILRLHVRGMISATDLRLAHGRTRKWVDIRDQAIRMAIHAVPPMAQAASNTTDLTLANRPRFHRRRQFQCLLTIAPLAHLSSLHPPAHVVVHPSAERTRGTAHMGDLHPVAVIHLNLPIMGRLHVIKTTIPVPKVLL